MKKNWLKKSLSIFLICLMTMTMVSFTGIGAMAASKILYTCNFSGANTNEGSNSADRGTLEAFGWPVDKWAYNIHIGEFGYDADADKNYIAVQDSNSAHGLFSINDTAIESGKLYFSLSYRRTPTANDGVYLELMDGSDNRIVFAKLASNLELRKEMLGGAEVTVGDFTDGNWHNVGFLFDLEEGTYLGYVDGLATSKSLELPEGLDGIQYFGLAIASSDPLGDVTDFSVKSVIGENTVTSDAVINGNTVSVTFDEAIGTTITADMVSIQLCGSDETVEVTGVSQVGNVVNIKYDEELRSGREYRVSFDENVKTLFGTSLPASYFSTLSETIVTPIVGGDNSAVNANGVVDFENLTSNGDGTFTLPADFHSYISPHGNQIQIVEVNNLKNAEGAAIASGSGNDSKYAVRGTSWFGLPLGKTRPEGFKGTIVYEFDYYFPSHSNAAPPYVILQKFTTDWVDRSDSIYEFWWNSSWQHFKLEYNFITKMATIHIEDEKVAEETVTLDDVHHMNIMFGNDMIYADMFVDNFTQYYVEETASVKSVRYVDVTGNKSGLDTITPSTKAIEIAFSADMLEETLDDITLEGANITGSSYNEDTFTYTIELDDLLSQNTPYTLTIPGTVSDKNGAVVPETTYNFSTTAGEFKVQNLRITRDDEEISGVDNIAGAEIKVNLDVINTLGTEGDITLIYCFYDDDALVAVDYDTVSLDEGMETLKSRTFTVKSGITPDSGKALAWKGDISDLEPLMPGVEY